VTLAGEVRVEDDVPTAYAALVTDAVNAAAGGSFVLGCSGGASGQACYRALSRRDDLDFARLTVVFADERCVDEGSPDSNAVSVGAAFGPRLAALDSYHPMSCAEGAGAYEGLLRGLGRIDLLQLGLGPDGHTASLFPGSPALSAPAGRLVEENIDPSGLNAFPRLTLTYAGIDLANLVVVTVVGADKADALSRLTRGEDLPAARLPAGKLLWLIDAAAREGLDS